ncbi:MopC [Desulforapulum autotrophicum HRM2]|uniref:MopC n=1 Tax=Desulforapulum autotrophicum (strain ATCC 43914 / DSM 3382 / VKM B-1955 / HRM2) TaxID=177437 RepID=C0Q9Q8_DESAH|nr:polysulfide reductase NrfD [Desulforapulum autotrophicum]ACN14622.1 MopC [Desulforapulum autotrophicum HRM2]
MTSMDPALPEGTALTEPSAPLKKSVFLIPALVAGGGFLFFIFMAAGSHPEKAWLAYLTNFMFFTILSCGGLLFSTLMHVTKARWSHTFAAVAEAFSAFFPVSFLLFLFLFIGEDHVFPWMGQNLHGKEVWLNPQFLFVRDGAAFLILYGLGFGYLYNSLKFRLKTAPKDTRLKTFLFNRFEQSLHDTETIRHRMTVLGVWYMFAFAMCLSLVGFDLVMSADPHWYSTLFGAYTFIKAIYAGFGAIILLVSILHLTPRVPFTLTPAQLADMSTLFFGFSIVWGDFFYSQFVVIWYGNIPEETAYIIERTMTLPWSYLAWTVFIGCFILPFIILLSRKIKQSPRIMIVISSCVLAGLWIEHFLLLGPSFLEHDPGVFPIGISAIIISLGFFGLMIISIIAYFKQFPEALKPGSGEVVQWK